MTRRLVECERGLLDIDEGIPVTRFTPLGYLEADVNMPYPETDNLVISAAQKNWGGDKGVYWTRRVMKPGYVQVIRIGE